MAPTVIIGSLLRRDGQTGLQTHARVVKRYLERQRQPVEFITPFSAQRAWALPVLGFGRHVVDRVDRPLGTWWHRYWRRSLVETAIRQRLRRGDEVVIYAQCPVVASAALAARRAAGRPEACRIVLVTHFNGSDTVDWVLQGGIKQGDWVFRDIKRLEHATLPRLDGIVYVSEYLRQTVEREVPEVSGVPSIVTPNFVFPCAQPPVSEPRADLVAVGTLAPRKNQRYLLRVLAEARRRGRRYTLDVIGDGPDKQRLIEEAQSLGVADQVRFLGSQPDAACQLGSYRALAHAAVMESFGIVLIEAMAAGRPIIAAPRGGVAEVFTDGVEGLYWPLDDPVEAAAKLGRLLDDDAAYARYSRAAVRRFETYFEPDVVGERLLRFLRS
jgi:glycosyltransferase involved in cell wall biosynthesis